MRSRNSRFLSVGAITTADFDGSPGLAVVMATSRHQGKYDLGLAMRVLADAAVEEIGWDDDGTVLLARMAVDKIVHDETPMIWRTVTKAENEHDCDRRCEPGTWCSNGAGKAWMKVLCVDLGHVEDALDRLHPEVLV